MKFPQLHPRRRTRIEIIPLIDIMFFLLASFMMVSLQMQKVQTVRASLPTATLARSNAKPDMVNVNVDSLGKITVDRKSITYNEFFLMLTNRLGTNPDLPVYITGQKETKHASMIFVLDLARRAGASRVAFAVHAADGTGAAGAR
jgi:biopolymer transport protein ExbD